MQGLDIALEVNEFVGRADELREIATLLDDPVCRLLTLLGPGGIGKSRLALELADRVAAHYEDGVHVVALQPLTSPEDMVSTIWEHVGYQHFSGGDPKAALFAFLNGKTMLLMMDNLEHVLSGVDLLSQLLAAAPGVTLLTTSRERLKLREEWTYEVRGLAYPPDVETYRAEGGMHSAVQLFVQCARRARPDFQLEDEVPGVVAISRLVEGMPLALEMAASWVRMLRCDEIAAEIEHNLSILELSDRNTPSRHRTMRAVLDHSWAMLGQEQQDVFASLSICRGGFSREAAEAVSGASLRDMAILLDKSWLRWDPERNRYDIQELLRQYGEEQLGQGGAAWESARDRHCDYFADLLAQQEQLFKTNGYGEALAAIEGDIDNVRACWDWAIARRKTTQLDRSLVALCHFYSVGSRFQNGERVFAKALRALETGRSQSEIAQVYARLQAHYTRLVTSLHRMEEARALLENSLENSPRA